MDPFLLMGLMKGVQSVGTGISDFTAAEQAFGRSQEERLKELQRREELGTLGFTGEEQNRIMRDLLNPIQARERERAIQTRGILGAGDLGASQTAIANLIQGDKEEAARAGASETYLQQQMAEKKRQQAELRDLEKAKDAERAAKTQAVLQAVTMGIMGGAETAQRKALFDEMRYGQTAADTAARGGVEGPPLTPEQFSEAMDLMGYLPGSGG